MSEEQQEVRAVPDSMKAVTKFTAEHAREVGLPSPEAVNYMMSIANMLLNSALITLDMALPDNEIGRLKGMGYDANQINAVRSNYVRSNAMAKMLVGHEMSIDPMAALQDIDIVKGKIFVRYPQLIDQMIRKGFTVKWLERTNERAAIEVSRPGVEAEVFSFSIEDAKMAGLTKSDKDGMYEKRPRVMLSARACSEAYRMTGGRGNVYTPEEKGEIFPDSAAAEPSESDRKRAEVIAARDDMKVSLKTKPEPETIIVEAEKPAEAEKSAEVPEPRTNPEPQQAGPKPVAGELKYAIHKVFQTEDNGERVLPTEELPQKRESDAKLRAQAMANETDSAYDIVEINTATGEVRTTARCNPPKPIKQAEKPAEKPKAEPSKPKAAKSPSDAKADAKAALIFRLTPLAAALGLPGKTAGSRFNAFFAGLFGCKLTELPKETSAYDVAVEELEACVNGDINEFQASPEEAGARRARWAKETRNYLDGQYPKNPETVQLGVTLARRWRLSPTDFKGWFESSVIGLDFVPQADSHAFMRVMLATPTHRSGSELLRWFKKASLPNGTLARAVEQIEQRGLKCSLESAHEDAVDRAVKAWLMAAKEQAPETVQEPTEAQPKEEEGGLFDDLV